MVSSELNLDMGFYHNNKRIWVRNAEDFNDIKKSVRSSDNITLWCMGVSDKRRQGKRRHDYSDSNSECDSGDTRQRSRSKSKTKYEEKVEHVDELVDELKLKHGTIYTNIQYRVCAETIESQNHSSMDNPPPGSFFKNQGEKNNPSTTGTPGPSGALTPQKIAQLRSTYI